MWLRDLKWWLLVRHSGILAVLAFVAGIGFVWSGFYNVAASRDHWPITTWILERVRIQSVATWSYFSEDPPALDDPDRIRLGATHFEGGCAPCHGRPGEPINAIVDSMLPPPPPLTNVTDHLGTKEIFWTVKHGLKYTAMPAWPAQERDDEVWALTAFLMQLPDSTAEDYRELAAIDRAPPQPRDGGQLASASETVALTQCARCHGDASSAPISDLIPGLNGQSQAYLERALLEYAEGTRHSGVMQPVADLLDRDEIESIATFYSGLEPERNTAPTGDPDQVARGRELASNGDPERGVPACLACHSSGRAESFPNLAGLSQRYLETQLQLWRDEGRDTTVYGRIMAPVARRLTEEQVQDAAAYFSSLDANDLGPEVTSNAPVDE